MCEELCPGGGRVVLFYNGRFKDYNGLYGIETDLNLAPFLQISKIYRRQSFHCHCRASVSLYYGFVPAVSLQYSTVKSSSQ